VAPPVTVPSILPVPVMVPPLAGAAPVPIRAMASVAERSSVPWDWLNPPVNDAVVAGSMCTVPPLTVGATMVVGEVRVSVPWGVITTCAAAVAPQPASLSSALGAVRVTGPDTVSWAVSHIRATAAAQVVGPARFRLRVLASFGVPTALVTVVGPTTVVVPAPSMRPALQSSWPTVTAACR
jgi:hypothetical protein